MKKISLTDFLVSLEKKGARVRDILLPLFSFIFLRNILEGMFEKEHLFGFNPYPYRSFLILFIHFPLFYVCLFLMLSLIFMVFYPRGSESPYSAFKKIAGSIAHMFWIILLPPVIDLVASGGRGYELSYILKDADPLILVSLLFQSNAGQYGVSLGMRVEIFLALLFCFTWIYLKRKNIFLALLGMVTVYLLLLFTGLLPLIVASICGESFAAFYSSGGILYYDTQKLAAVFFLLLFLLILLIYTLFLKKDMRRVFGFKVSNVVLLLAMCAGFVLGLKKFLDVVPGFWIASDFLAVVVLVGSSFFVLRTDLDRVTAPFVILGLTMSLIISYYTFLALLAVVILAALSKKWSSLPRGIIMVPACIFASLAGLTVFTHERVFSALTQQGQAEYHVQKTEWNNEESVIREIENALRNQDWKKHTDLFLGKPYFVSPGAVLYLEGVFHMLERDFESAMRFLNGAVSLGYQTERVLKTRGDLYVAMHEYAEAIAVYQNLLANGFTDGTVHKSLATAYFATQDYLNSIRHYLQAIEQEGKDPALYNNLGVAYLEISDYENARTAFLHALELDPQMAQARKNLVLTELRIKK